MRNLLEIKEMLKKLYSKNEVFIVPLMKFVLAFITLLIVNGKLGYMSNIDNIAVVLMVSLLCSFLPNGLIILFAGLFVLLHFYALSVEIALVGFCVFLVMCLLFFRFAPKDALVVLLTPICFILKIPYVIPISMGLIGTPASAISVGCGTIIYYMISYVSVNAPIISSMGTDEATAKIRMIIDAILGNKAMLVTVIAFIVTVVVVYIIRRMSIDHSWTVAIIAGTMINVVILLIGDLMYDTNVSIFAVLFGSLVSAGLTKALQFFVFNVDYSRTEKVQFEDDEYYYYVKAVPKMNLAPPTKTVKKINQGMIQQGRTSVGDRVTPGNAKHQRSVTTERTGNVNRTMQNTRLQSGHSVTTGKNISREDFEEL